MNGFFDITPEDLGRLSSQEAVVVFRNLIFAEAKLIGGIDFGKINIPSSYSAIATRDGGIDGQVSDARPKRDGHGIIKHGLTCYQIKTGTTTVNTKSKAIRVISTKQGICSRVRSCIENNGTLVIALFGNDAPDREYDNSVRCVQEAIAHYMPAYASYPKIEVWQQSTIVGFLEDFPSLCMAAKKQRPTELMTIDLWARLASMNRKVVLGSKQTKAVETIRHSILSGNAEALRILGEAGVGKTRLVLEALNCDGYRETVLYAEKPSMLPDGFLNSLIMTDSTTRCILVVDECDLAHHDDIWNRVASVSDRIKLITIFNNTESQHSGCSAIEISPLEQEEIVTIIRSYGIPDYWSRSLAAFCSGSPRVAHILGDQISRTGNLDISNMNDIWPRCIADTDEITGEAARKRIRVLTWLSLFRRFGYEGPYKEEGRLVVAKISQSTSMPESEIREIIRHLREKKLLQGDYTLYITPRLMHIWLWANWWNDHASCFNYQDFKRIDAETELSERLLDWFFDMLQYGRETNAIRDIVDNMISPHGPFASPTFLQSGTGERLLGALADIAPRETLSFIETSLMNIDIDSLREMKAGRRGLVDALQRIAWNPRLFERAGKLLLRFALAENEIYANNATGIFCNLFSCGIGPIAPSLAAAKDRLLFLERLALSGTPEEQTLAIKAISKGLEISTTTLKPLREADFLHGEMNGWSPETYGEWWDAYRQIWKLGLDCLEQYEEENRTQLADVLSERGIRLVEFIGDGSEVVDWLLELVKSGYANKTILIKGISGLLRHSPKLDKNVQAALERLQDSIIGFGYQSEMHRFVGIDVLEDELDNEAVLKDKLQSLARHSVTHPKDLLSLLPWLTTAVPARAESFGFELGSLDDGFAQWAPIKSAMVENNSTTDKKADPRLCSGYLRAVYEKDVHIWEEYMAQVIHEETIACLSPAIASGSGMTNAVFELIAEAYENNVIDAISLTPLRFGKGSFGVSNDHFQRLLNMLIRKDDVWASRLAVSLVYTYIHKGGSIPADLKLQIVTHKLLFQDSQRAYAPSYGYHWSELCKKLIDEDRSTVYEIASYTATTLSNSVYIEPCYVEDVFMKASETNPTETWKAVASFFESRDLNVTTRFGDLFNDRSSKPLDIIPIDIIIGWINEDPETRAAAIASSTPSLLRSNQGKPTLARKLLVEYGNLYHVNHALHIKARNYSWSGSQAEAISHRIQELSGWEKTETDNNVLQWINEEIDTLQKGLADARARDERDW